MVDYRGPKFLQPFCQRWNLDLFDRVVEIQLLEQTDLLRESVQNFPELQTLTLAPRFSAEDSNAWVKVAKQVQDLPVEAFLNVYEREGKLFPYSFVVLGARRSEPWTPHTGYQRHSIAEYLQDQELQLAEVVKQATEAAQRDSVAATCESNPGLLACAAKSPTP